MWFFVTKKQREFLCFFIEIGNPSLAKRAEHMSTVFNEDHQYSTQGKLFQGYSETSIPRALLSSQPLPVI